MSKFKLTINIPGFNDVRTSTGVAENLSERGQRIAAAAGGEPDFEVINSPSKTRARVVVLTATVDGMVAEAQDRSLSRALDAGR